MARFDSYNWDHELGICRKHELPAVPCPACFADCENDGDMHITLSDFERSSFCDEPDMPMGFNPEIHQVL